MIEKQIITTEEEIYYCDECGKCISTHVYSCTCCGKHLCYTCTVNSDMDLDDDDFCEACWKIGHEYMSKIIQLRNKIEDLKIEWKSKCKPYDNT